MKVQIKNLMPNPYRDMANYPIDKDKIESLKNSIEQTGFWDNILAREINGKIQIAYGHHRLEALKQVMKPTDEVDIPVKKLDDSMMIQIMANENSEQWKMNPQVIIETVKVTRDFLNAELAKYESWERVNSSIKSLFTSPESFTKTKDTGVGQTTILKFLGKNWRQHQIQFALNTLDDQEIELKAVTTFQQVDVAKEFQKAVRNINKEAKAETGKIKITPEETPVLAEKIKQRIQSHKGQSIQGKSHRSNMSTMIRQEVDEVDEFDAVLKDLELEVKKIEDDARRLNNQIQSFNGKLHSMKVENLKSLSTMFTMQEFATLWTSINVLSNYFGYTFNNEIKGEIE